MMLAKKIKLLPIFNFLSAMPIIEKVTDCLGVSNNISDLEVVYVIHPVSTNMSIDTIVNSENEIKCMIIDEEIVDIIESCKTKDLNNQVEILKCIYTRLVQGRPL